MISDRTFDEDGTELFTALSSELAFSCHDWQDAHNVQQDVLNANNSKGLAFKYTWTTASSGASNVFHNSLEATSEAISLPAGEVSVEFEVTGNGGGIAPANLPGRDDAAGTAGGILYINEPSMEVADALINDLLGSVESLDTNQALSLLNLAASTLPLSEPTKVGNIKEPDFDADGGGVQDAEWGEDDDGIDLPTPEELAAAKAARLAAEQKQLEQTARVMDVLSYVIASNEEALSPAQETQVLNTIAAVSGGTGGNAAAMSGETALKTVGVLKVLGNSENPTAEGLNTFAQVTGNLLSGLNTGKVAASKTTKPKTAGNSEGTGAASTADEGASAAEIAAAETSASEAEKKLAKSVVTALVDSVTEYTVSLGASLAVSDPPVSVTSGDGSFEARVGRVTCTLPASSSSSVDVESGGESGVESGAGHVVVQMDGGFTFKIKESWLAPSVTLARRRRFPGRSQRAADTRDDNYSGSGSETDDLGSGSGSEYPSLGGDLFTLSLLIETTKAIVDMTKEESNTLSKDISAAVVASTALTEADVVSIRFARVDDSDLWLDTLANDATVVKEPSMRGRKSSAAHLMDASIGLDVDEDVGIQAGVDIATVLDAGTFVVTNHIILGVLKVTYTTVDGITYVAATPVAACPEVFQSLAYTENPYIWTDGANKGSIAGLTLYAGVTNSDGVRKRSRRADGSMQSATSQEFVVQDRKECVDILINKSTTSANLGISEVDLAVYNVTSNASLTLDMARYAANRNNAVHIVVEPFNDGGDGTATVDFVVQTSGSSKFAGSAVPVRSEADWLAASSDAVADVSHAMQILPAHLGSETCSDTSSFVLDVEMTNDATYTISVTTNSETEVRFNIRVFEAQCIFLNESMGTWSDAGCSVAPESTPSLLQCKCNHLTSFGSNYNAGAFIKPNLVAVRTITAADIAKNSVVFITLLLIWALFLLLLWRARVSDKNDVLALGPVYLHSNSSEHNGKYRVTVKTGVRPNAGLGKAARVFIKFVGYHGETSFIELGHEWRPLFLRNGTDVFIVTTPLDLGPIKSVIIRHDAHGPDAQWYLSYIEVHNIFQRAASSGRYFFFNSWLALDIADGLIELEAEGYTERAAATIERSFMQRLTSGIADNHTIVSVFLGPPASRFTKVERTMCCHVSVMYIIFANAWFYQSDGSEKTVAQIITTGLVSSIVILVPTSMVIFLFKHARRRINKEPVTQAIMATTWTISEMIMDLARGNLIEPPAPPPPPQQHCRSGGQEGGGSSMPAATGGAAASRQRSSKIAPLPLPPPVSAGLSPLHTEAHVSTEKASSSRHKPSNSISQHATALRSMYGALPRKRSTAKASRTGSHASNGAHSNIGSESHDDDDMAAFPSGDSGNAAYRRHHNAISSGDGSVDTRAAEGGSVDSNSGVIESEDESSWELPPVCRELAWLISLSSTMWASYYVLLLSIDEFGASASLQWLQSLFCSLLLMTVATDPVSITFFALFGAYYWRDIGLDSKKATNARLAREVINTNNDTVKEMSMQRSKTISKKVIRAPKNSTELRKKRLARQKEMNGILKKILAYFLFYVCLLIVVIGQKDNGAFQMAGSILDQVHAPLVRKYTKALETPPIPLNTGVSGSFDGTSRKYFGSIATHDDYFVWLRSTIGTMFDASTGEAVSKTNLRTPTLAGRDLVMVGAARLRQLRVSEDGCTPEVPAELVDFVGSTCTAAWQKGEQEAHNSKVDFAAQTLENSLLPDIWRYGKMQWLSARVMPFDSRYVRHVFVCVCVCVLGACACATVSVVYLGVRLYLYMPIYTYTYIYIYIYI